MMLTRRALLTGGACALAALAGPPRFLARAAGAAEARGGKVLVALFQRGAVDGLSVVVPHGDGAYYATPGEALEAFHAAAVATGQDCLPRGGYLVDRATGAATDLHLLNDAIAISRNARAVLFAAPGNFREDDFSYALKLGLNSPDPGAFRADIRQRLRERILGV